jgi:hypothetical protein
MMKRLGISEFLTWVLIAVVAAGIAGCKDLGVTPPQSTEQRIAYGYSTVTAVRTEAANLLDAGKIDVKTARTVQDTADLARASLDQARAYQAAGDTQKATQAVAAATALLTSLQQLLATHK